jgi:dephospho-CoA kinase
MLLVALTGNIASGKSSVAAGLARRGATVIDSDTAAREAVAPGTPALAAIVRRFGHAMLLADGSLDRQQLGRVVFSDAAARQALEAIVHPAVEAARVDAVARAAHDGATIVVCDIPLLFEARLAWQFPRVLLVDAPEPIRIARLVTHRGMPDADARARVRAQLPAALKRPRADLVIPNDGTREALVDAIADAWHRLTAWAG